MQIFIPSKKLKSSKIENYLCALLVILSLQVVSQSVYIKPDANKTSCGLEVIDFLHQNYFSEAGLHIPVSKKELTFSELLSFSKELNPLAQAIMLSGHEINDLPAPCILHLSANHYIALLGKSDNNMYKIFDPAAPHLKAVGITYLLEYFSKNAIIFTSVHQFALLDEDDLKAITGSYLHEYPPPNEDDDCTDCGDDDENIENDDCGDGSGSPKISFNPLNLNLVVTDIPMWYNAGVGPDIALKLAYNGNDLQDLPIALPPPTQYYPIGKSWSFAYSAFYHQVSEDTIIVILPDGAKETYFFSGNYSTPKHKDNYNTFRRYLEPGLIYSYRLTIKETQIVYYFEDPIHKKLTAVGDANDNKVTIQYDSNLNISSLTDANDRITTFTLNADGRIIQATDPIGRTAHFQYGYTNNEFLMHITDMGGYTSSIYYDSVKILQQAIPGYHYEDRITSVVTPNGSTQINYEATGVIGPGNLAYEVGFTDEPGNKSNISFEYFTQNTGIVKSIDKNGNTTSYYMDLPNKRIDYILYPDLDATVFYSYDANDNRTSISRGTHETTYVYDSTGNVIHMTDPRNKTTDYTYDEKDNLISITDPMNRTTTFEYDANNNITAVITPGKIESFTHFSNGNMQSHTDGNGNTTYITYDVNGYRSSVVHPLSDATTFIYDIAGRLISQTSNGVTINFEYDDLNQNTKTLFPDNTYIKNDYDFQNLIQTTDRGGRKTYYSHDCGGSCQLTYVHSPVGDIAFTRDAEGNVLTLNINGQTTLYEYNNMKSRIRKTNPDGTFRQFDYDELGNLITRIDEKGIRTKYFYDYNLLVWIDYSDNTPDVSLTYNERKQLTSMSDGTGTTNYSYDLEGRFTGKDGPETDDAIIYTYDENGNRLAMSLPGLNVSYTYNERNRMTQVSSDYASAGYEYDNHNKLVKMTYGNGAYTDYDYDGLNRMVQLNNKKSSGEIFSGFYYSYDPSSMINNIEDQDGNVLDYQYDYAYRLIDENVQTNSGKNIWHNGFTYDNMGNRLKLIKNGITDSYSYNINNQLTNLTETVINVSGYVYGDSAAKVFVENIQANTTYLGNNIIKFEAINIPIDNGNDSVLVYSKVNDILSAIGDSSKFVTTTSKYPDGSINVNLFTEISGVDPAYINTIRIKRNNIQFSYDLNGNMIQKIMNFDTSSFFYDAENRLIRIELPGGKNEEFIYDGYGQRIKRLENGNFHKRYIYDYLFEPIVLIDTTNNIQYFTRGLSHRGGIGGVISSNSGAYETIYYLYNNRGDIINALDTDNSILGEFQFDAFGSIKYKTTDFSPVFGYSSKEYDRQIDLVYFGYRYYSIGMGRWFNKDPIGYGGGVNLYVYLHNNSVNSIDPYGLDDEVVADEEVVEEEYGWSDYITNFLKAVADAISPGPADPFAQVDLAYECNNTTYIYLESLKKKCDYYTEIDEDPNNSYCQQLEKLKQMSK